MIRNTEVLGAGLPNVWHACLKWHTERFPWHATFTSVPFFFKYFFYPTRVSTLLTICLHVLYIHISDCVGTVYELRLVPNSTAVKHFYTNRERCEVLTGYLSLGHWAGRWLGDNVTLNKTFIIFSSIRK
jgi:hypothetical protein